MTAIQTKGIGVRITSHLNLTRTMADNWADRRAYRWRYRPQLRPSEKRASK